VLGHELINSRDAYSLPTDEELKEAYMKAYETHVKIEPTTKKKLNETIKGTVEKMLDVAEARTMEEVKQLLAKGYKHQMEMNGIQLFTK
jgi:Zn/Cd-binding protein ZinT